MWICYGLSGYDPCNKSRIVELEVFIQLVDSHPIEMVLSLSLVAPNPLLPTGIIIIMEINNLSKNQRHVIFLSI